jgi:hypothetical protein
MAVDPQVTLPIDFVDHDPNTPGSGTPFDAAHMNPNFVELASAHNSHTHSEYETPAGAQAKADAAQAAAEAASIPLTQKGVANGVASLGANGLVPASQIGGSSPSVALSPNIDETFALSGPRTVTYTSATEVQVPVMVAPFPLVVTGLKVITPTAQAASDSDYWLVMLRRRRMSLAVYELANLLSAQSPYGWWKLNETSGTTAADSGSGAHTLTMSTTAPTLNQPSLARRASDPSMTFVAASSTNLHDTNNTNWGYAQQITIVAMIKPTALAVGNTGRASIFSRVASGHPMLELGGKAGKGRLAFTQPTVGFQSETDDYTILPGNTYMVAFRKNGSGATKDFFVNGVKQRYGITTYLDSDLATTGAATYIGSREAAGTPTGQYFDGGIDEVAVFKSALSDATLQQFADVAAPMAEIGRKTTKTAASGGEGITAWQPWTFDGVPIDPYASVCDKDDVVSVSFYPVGTPGSLSDVILEVTYEAL